MLVPAIWYHEIASDWNSPVLRHWLAEALRDHQLVRTDLRGTGSSGAYAGPWSLEQLVGDFASVADASKAEQFDMLAFSHGGLVALCYAAAYPERVRKIVLVGGYCRGFAVRGDPEEISRRDNLRALSRSFKGSADPTFAQMIGSLYWPGARGETVDWFSTRLKTIDRLDERLEDVFRTADLKEILHQVRSDVLLLHSRGDRVVGFDCAEEIADELPHAQLVPLDSDNHVVIATEPAWSTARRALRLFLDELAQAEPRHRERVRA
jgi:pimeloyl-ACP methyl ester carboxylesterase